jgi:ABC-type branched-subunit amino acid transport system ATPase component
MLKIHGLCKSFDGIKAVDNFSLAVPEGSIMGLIGPNGAGKTTLFNIITGFIEPDRGEVLYRQEVLNGLPPWAIARKGIARTFQDLRLIYKFSALDNVLLAFQDRREEGFWGALLQLDRYSRKQREEKALALLEFVGLLDKAHEPAGELSYGQQKLLTLACALAMEADLLLLDEPVAGVQPVMIEKILDLLEKLQAQGKTILMIEHNLEAVMEISDRICVMDQGRKVIEGEPALILEDPRVIEAYMV